MKIILSSDADFYCDKNGLTSPSTKSAHKRQEKSLQLSYVKLSKLSDELIKACKQHKVLLNTVDLRYFDRGV